MVGELREDRLSGRTGSVWYLGELGFIHRIPASLGGSVFFVLAIL